MIELFDETLRYEAVAQVLGKGYSPVDYTLLCYGGGGPLHVAGYTEGVPYRDVLVPTWAAGLLRLRLRLRRLRLPLRPHDRHADRARRADEDEKAGIGDARRRRLADAARAGARRSSRSPASAEDAIEFRHYVRMQYYGQLNDLEVYAPHQAIEEASTSTT